MARDISTSDNILDSRDIEARIVELEDYRRPWSCGWNMPGYMPDSDPCYLESWEDARDYIADEIERAAENLDAETDADKIAAHDEAVKRIRALEDEEEIGETVGQYHYWASEIKGDSDLDDTIEDETDRDEIKVWRAVKDECENYGWEHGICFVRESYFKDYAIQLADDLGTVDSNAGWPANCIDWDQAAKELEQDYSSVEIDGDSYYWREA